MRDGLRGGIGRFNANGLMGEKAIYRLVSTSLVRTLESPFLLRGERVASFVLEEAALRMAVKLRDSKACPTVYGCYQQEDGTWLIGPSSARPVGKFRQTLSLREEKKPDASTPVWKNVTVGRVVRDLDAFVDECLWLSVSRLRR